MKNSGSALLRESDTTSNNFPLGLRVLIVDHDQQSLQEMEANLRRFGYEGYFLSLSFLLKSARMAAILFLSFFIEFKLRVSNGRELAC